MIKLHKRNKEVKDMSLAELLNKAIASELQAIIQYFWQHIMAVGKQTAAITPLLKEVSRDEMKHAEMIAERLNYLGVEPTTKPSEIQIGHTLDEMLHFDADNEEKTISLYKIIIEKAQEQKDHTTRVLFENILTDEEEHHDLFTRLLEK